MTSGSETVVWSELTVTEDVAGRLQYIISQIGLRQGVMHITIQPRILIVLPLIKLWQIVRLDLA